MNKRLFLILFLLGFAGVLSFLLVDLTALIASFPLPAGTEVPVITPVFKLLTLIQPTVLVLVAVLIGVVLAPQVGLRAPVAEALAARRGVLPSLRPQLVPGLVGGIVGGGSILLVAGVLQPLPTTDTIERIDKLGTLLPMLTRLLYGGVIEELLLRWGFMTLLVWITWRLFQKRLAKPASVCFIVAILVSSIVFGLGHLPIAILLLPHITVVLSPFAIL